MIIIETLLFGYHYEVIITFNDAIDRSAEKYNPAIDGAD